MIFDPSYAAEILPRLLRASVVTVQATAGGFAISLVLGLAIAVGRGSAFGWLSRLAYLYVLVIRNTPFIIQLFILFFVLPQYGITMSPLLTGIVGLGLHFSAYTAEIYRAGIDSVPKGQWEAAVALNFHPRHTWMRIVLPQAVPPMTPVLGNTLIGMFKDSVVLMTISVVELLGAAAQEASRSFRYTEPLLIVGAIFLVMSLAGSAGVRALEARFAAHG
jgi:polar amino acid transport system permease protein